jgi:ribonuclease HII
MLKARYSTADTLLEAGVDEAGRGCLWGCLIAAAVIWPAEETWTGEMKEKIALIKDSKKLTPKRRAMLNTFIRQHALSYGVGRVEPGEIDDVGMTAANRLAFSRAIAALSIAPGRLLVDGILGLPDCSLPQIIEPEADNRYLAVAAASILAKETRDTLVVEACAADPALQDRYAILNSKGYGTAKHREGLKTHGMHTGHRKLFLRKILGIDHVPLHQQTQYGFADE